MVPASEVLFRAEVTDLAGDTRFPTSIYLEDLVYGSVSLTADRVMVEARMAPGTLVGESEIAVALDLDQDPTSGDVRDGIGYEIVLTNGTTYDDPETLLIRAWNPTTFSFDEVGRFDLERLPDGWRADFPRSALQGDDGLLDFRMESSHALSAATFTQYLDAMPDRPGVASTAPTAAGALDLLDHAVDDLADAGTLSAGQANGLRAKLAAAWASIARGDTTAACSQLAAFINQVEAFMASGTLTPAEGTDLIHGANDVRGLVGC